MQCFFPLSKSSSDYNWARFTAPQDDAAFLLMLSLLFVIKDTITRPTQPPGFSDITFSWTAVQVSLAGWRAKSTVTWTTDWTSVPHSPLSQDHESCHYGTDPGTVYWPRRIQTTMNVYCKRSSKAVARAQCGLSRTFFIESFWTLFIESSPKYSSVLYLWG